MKRLALLALLITLPVQAQMTTPQQIQSHFAGQQANLQSVYAGLPPIAQQMAGPAIQHAMQMLGFHQNAALQAINQAQSVINSVPVQPPVVTPPVLPTITTPQINTLIPVTTTLTPVTLPTVTTPQVNALPPVTVTLPPILPPPNLTELLK